MMEIIGGLSPPLLTGTGVLYYRMRMNNQVEYFVL